MKHNKTLNKSETNSSDFDYSVCFLIHEASVDLEFSEVKNKVFLVD